MEHDAFEARTEVRDGMRITWHQPIPVDDGTVLRADVFRPVEDGRYPVILTYGIYAKGVAYQEGYPHQWGKMVADHPEILEGSTNKYQNWEVTDPERWVRWTSTLPSGSLTEAGRSRQTWAHPSIPPRASFRPGSPLTASTCSSRVIADSTPNPWRRPSTKN